MAENIGDAYIEVHANTRNLPAELKAAARLAAQEFPKEFSKTVGSQIDDALTPKGRQLRGRYTAAGKLSGQGWADGFGAQVKSVLDHLDSSIGKGVLFGDWSAAIGQFDDIDKAVDKISARMKDLHESNKDLFNAKDLESALRQLGKFADEVKLDAVAADAERLNKAFDQLAISEGKADARQMQREVRDLIRQQTEDVKLRNAQEDQAFATNQKMNKAIQESRRLEQEWHTERQAVFRSALEDLIRLDGGLEKFTKNTHANLLRVSKDLRESLGSDAIDHAAFTSAMNSIEDDIKRGDRALGNLKRSVGDVHKGFQLLGSLEGSRNNFFNAVGIIGGAAERAISALASKLLDPRGLIQGVQNLGQTINENGGGITGFFSTIGQSLSNLASGGGDITTLVKVAVAITAAGGAAVLAGAGFGALVAGISGLAAIATALASSIGIGLVGALLPLGPIVLAAAAGVGALFFAFQNAKKELKDSVAPVRDWFNAVQEPVRAHLFKDLAADMGAFSGTLNGFVTPLLIAAADSLNATFAHLATALSDPAVQSTLTQLGTVLPPILTGLGTAFTDFLTGALGFFTPIAGFSQTLVDNVSAAAATFSTWANSVSGQNAIRDFMVGASTSAQILWDLVLSLGGAIGTLMSQGKAQGDSFLSSITGIVDEFTTWANSDEGRTKIADWMAFGAQLASHLGALVAAIGQAFINLDNPQTHEILLFLIDAMTTLVGWTGRFLVVSATMADMLLHGFQHAADAVQAFGHFVSNTVDAAIDDVKRLIHWLGEIKIPNLPSLGNLVQGLGNGIAKLAGPHTAIGGVFSGAQSRVIGEAGPEAVVPLSRSLSQVDPSVRWLSALAQGKSAPPMGSGGIGGAGPQIVVGPGAVQMVVPSAQQAFQVASSMWDALIGGAK